MPIKNNLNEPLFSVIIPTKDRAEYLQHTLATCSFQNYENLEIIVSDDGSSDHTRDVVMEAASQDSRIKYVTPGKNVGMWANFEFLLNKVKPGYVIALGGDDGLLPEGISGMREVLRSTGSKLLAWPTPTFIYPKVRMEKAQLILHANKGRIEKGLEIIKSNDFLARQAKNLGYVFDDQAPMFYVKGVASTELIDRVKRRSYGGHFYSCSTPDGYSGIVLAGEVESYAFSKTPFSIHGASPSSQGVAFLSDNPDSKKQANDFFNLAAIRPMHKELAGAPYSPLIALMTADYLLTAQDLPGWGGKFPPIDYKKMLSIGLSELLNAQWAEERIVRELQILNMVANFHGLGEFFKNKVKTSRRNLWSPLEGNAISPSKIFIDCGQNGIENIVEAAYVAYSMHKIFPEISSRVLWDGLKNSLLHKLRFLKIGPRLPNERAWQSND